MTRCSAASSVLLVLLAAVRDGSAVLQRSETGRLCERRLLEADTTETILLQTSKYATARDRLVQDGTADEVHCVFVSDCRPFNLWQSELLFFSAQRVGQRGPITQIVSGCSDEKRQRVLQRFRSLGLPSDFDIDFAPKMTSNISTAVNKPYSVKHWYKSKGPRRDVVAVLDPDFLFIRPLTALLDGASAALGWNYSQPVRVQPGIVAAQRYSLRYPTSVQDSSLFEVDIAASGFADNQSMLAHLCTGNAKDTSSGCYNLTNYEVGLYHATGVPYIAHRADWDWLVEDWATVTSRIAEATASRKDGFYYVDMWSWVLANANRRKRQLALHNMMMTSWEHPQDRYEEWSGVDALTSDPCHADLADSALQAKLPHFIHYCTGTKYFNKYHLQWGEEDGVNAIESCGQVQLKSLEFGKGAEEAAAVLTSVQVKAQNQSTLRQRFFGCTTRRIFEDASKELCRPM